MCGVFVCECLCVFAQSLTFLQWKRKTFFKLVIQYLQHQQVPVCKTVKQGPMWPELVFILFSFNKQWLLYPGRKTPQMAFCIVFYIMKWVLKQIPIPNCFILKLLINFQVQWSGFSDILTKTHFKLFSKP